MLLATSFMKLNFTVSSVNDATQLLSPAGFRATLYFTGNTTLTSCQAVADYVLGHVFVSVCN